MHSFNNRKKCMTWKIPKQFAPKGGKINPSKYEELFGVKRGKKRSPTQKSVFANTKIYMGSSIPLIVTDSLDGTNSEARRNSVIPVVSAAVKDTKVEVKFIIIVSVTVTQ